MRRAFLSALLVSAALLALAGWGDGERVGIQAINAGPQFNLLAATGIARVPAGGTIELRAFQSSGGALGTAASDASFNGADLAVQWLGP